MTRRYPYLHTVLPLFGLLVLLFALAAPASAAVPGLPMMAAGEAAPAAEQPLVVILAPGSLSAEEQARLLAGLSNASGRPLEIRELADVALGASAGTAGASPSGPMASALMHQMAGFENQAQRFRDNFLAALQALPRLPEVGELLAQRLSAGEATLERNGPHRLLLFLLLLPVAFVVEGLLLRLLLGPADRPVAPPASFSQHLGHALLRLLTRLLGLGVFLLVIVGAGTLIPSHGPAASRTVALYALIAIVHVRLIAILARFLLAPGQPALRLVPFTDAAARGLYRGLLGLTLVTAPLHYAIQMLGQLGLAPELERLLALLQGTLGMALFLLLAWHFRAPIAALCAGSGEVDSWRTRLRRQVAPHWFWILAPYVMAIWMSAMYTRMTSAEQGRITLATAGSMLILIFLFLGMAAAERLIHEYFQTRHARRHPGESVPPSYQGLERAIQRVVRFALVLAAIIGVARLWGLDPLSMSAVGVGERVLDTLVQVGVTVLLAYLLWVVIKHALDRYFGDPEAERAALAHPGEGEGGGAGATRLHTLVPLLRKFLFVAVLVVAALQVLSALGINIAPLLAGAGVVGLALGFGAQTLVKDIISGLFFLLDDAFRLGEYVDIGTVKGTVEKISIRSLRLRHHNGPLHTIPYGQISRLTNHSRDWVIVKFEIRVPFETDINKVRKIIKKIGQELQQDPELGPNLLEPLKSQGVHHMDDSALVIRCKFTAIPGQQFMIHREAFVRIQKAFKENGIPFAPRRVLVESIATSATSAQAAAAGGILDSAVAGPEGNRQRA
ncbi:MAG TPA: mechanosensitive ion channel domain-containing protein [Candidatus Competibacteraceae bacterium]|nr:mechanosensitive ion channel domain-containing protein [Candidatus Competibacteraceae bacterium]